MTHKITVLSKPSCVQCTMTKRVLDKNGLEYEEGDATSDQSLAFAAEHGIASAPIVIAEFPSGEKQVWGGFRDDLLKDYAASVASHGQVAA